MPVAAFPQQYSFHLSRITLTNFIPTLFVAKKIFTYLSDSLPVVRHYTKTFKKSTVMEKFMLIFHGGIKQDASPEDLQTNMGQWMAWVEQLNKDGRYVSGEPLLPGGKLVSGTTTVTDGPYTEGKEVVGGYFIINAQNMDEAVELTKNYPDFAYGGQVQVRQVMNLEM